MGSTNNMRPMGAGMRLLGMVGWLYVGRIARICGACDNGLRGNGTTAKAGSFDWGRGVVGGGHGGKGTHQQLVVSEAETSRTLIGYTAGRYARSQVTEGRR